MLERYDVFRYPAFTGDEERSHESEIIDFACVPVVQRVSGVQQAAVVDLPITILREEQVEIGVVVTPNAVAVNPAAVEVGLDSRDLGEQVLPDVEDHVFGRTFAKANLPHFGLALGFIASARFLDPVFEPCAEAEIRRVVRVC